MQKPNILIFMTDHQRADTVLPEHPAVTPNLAAFAQTGVTFTNVFCPSPHCCPSRATFMTGLYPSRHGVWNNICNAQALSPGIKPGIKIWSDDLPAAGYNLLWSGKWHVSINESPKDRGWDVRYISGNKAQEHSTAWAFYQNMPRAREDEQRGEGQILRPGYGTYTLYGNTGEKGNNHDERAVAEAIAALPGLAAAKNPWCLYVGCVAPHDPYCVPGKFLDMHPLEKATLPPNYADDMKDKPRIYRRMRRERFGLLCERETREAIRHFWAYCSYLDDLFGKVLAALEKTGQAENTLVLYCSDHGDYCGEHGLFAKGIPCFRGAYNVPAVLRWPAGIARPGRRENAFVSLADFSPTFQEVAGVERAPDSTGQSLAPFLRDQTPADWRDALHTQCNGVELYYTQRSVMTRNYKYVFNGFDDDELYDLRNDPHEMRNTAEDPAYAAIKRAMVQRLWRFAHREQDSAINNYITVALAPFGPAEAFRETGVPT